MNAITAEQIENLYNRGGQLELPNGDILTQDELVQYIGACDIDTDDNGTPLDSQWQILADVFGAPDPTNTAELVDVTATANALQSASDTPYVAQLEAHEDALTIVVRDLTAEAAIDEDPAAILDMTPHATFAQLGIFPGGLSNPSVKKAALDWLHSNGWETVADRDRIIAGYADSLWRVAEPLPVRPAVADDLSRVAVAASRIGQAEEARDEAIRKALAAGHSVIAIANAAGLSRARIYQIRDGRR